VVKEFEPEDPMELVGIAMPDCDSDQVLDGIVQEYLFMGWSAQQILLLFWSPHYGATHQIYLEKGAEYVKQRIRSLAENWDRGWIRGGEINA